jgi:hypothetical protein
MQFCVLQCGVYVFYCAASHAVTNLIHHQNVLADLFDDENYY